MPPRRLRLDAELVRRGLARSREHASDLVGQDSEGWEADRGPERTQRTGQLSQGSAFAVRTQVRCHGECPAEALQAAHIRRYAEHETHEISEGLLLRADVHLLFDNDLLAIDPETRTVVVSPALAAYPHYAALAGAKAVTEADPQVLREHFDRVTSNWS